jgi:hypothetical protein
MPDHSWQRRADSSWAGGHIDPVGRALRLASQAVSPAGRGGQFLVCHADKKPVPAEPGGEVLQGPGVGAGGGLRVWLGQNASTAAPRVRPEPRSPSPRRHGPGSRPSSTLPPALSQGIGSPRRYPGRLARSRPTLLPAGSRIRRCALPASVLLQSPATFDRPGTVGGSDIAGRGQRRVAICARFWTDRSSIDAGTTGHRNLARSSSLVACQSQ